MPWNESVTKVSFTKVETKEPHRLRRSQILAKHPEILDLYGPDIRLLPCILCALVAQLSLAVYCTRLPWNQWFLVCYSLGGTLTTTLSLGTHELTHNSCFRKPLYNEILACIANLSHVVPYAIAFKKYHIPHHYHQGDRENDVDIPSDWEAKVFNTTFRKILWLLIQPLAYNLRPLLIDPKPVCLKEWCNIVTMAAFNIWFAGTFGIKALLFNIVGLYFGMSLHPCAGHLISEHYTFGADLTQETFSCYGPLNWVCFNVGYHTEHHDFPRVSAFRLPLVRKIAPEFYDNRHYYTSWMAVMYEYIVRCDVGPYSRVVRTPSPKKKID